MKNNTQKYGLSNAEIALQDQFKAISKEDFALAFCQVEKSRNDFLVKAISFGLIALSMKSTIKHGDFKAWLCDALSRGELHADQSNYHTANRYIKLAQALIKQIEEPNENSLIAQRINGFCILNSIDKSNGYKLLSQSSSTLKLLKYIANGFSLRAFSNALVEANSQALAEEEAEKESEASKEKNDAVEAGNCNAITIRHAQQSDFFALLEADIANIDSKIKSPDFSRLERDQVSAYADALIERGNALKNILNS